MSLRTASRSALSSAKHIELGNVPTSITPADIRRLLWRSKVQDVQDVSIVYKNFMPTGRALLTLHKPNFLRDNLRALENATIAGIQISSKARDIGENIESKLGDGPHGSTYNGGKNILIWNLPGKAQISTIEPLVQGFALADCKDPIVKLRVDGFTMISRFLIRLASESEAHRLVRTLHMTDMEPEKFGRVHPVRAHVVY